MAFVLKDRVKEETTTTGTGAISLGGTSATFDQFQSYMSNGDTTYYTISHTATGIDEWEVGVGTWNTGNTLTRTTVLAGSNGTSAVNFSAGTKDVFMTYPADKAVFKDASGNLADVSLSNFDTDDLSEGSTNQYYTDARVNSHLSGGTGVTYSDGAISIGQAVGTSDNVTFNNITSGGTVTLNADPSAALQAATKQYVDTIASAGLHYHDPVRVEHPSNLNATYDNGSSGVGATLTNAGTNAAIQLDGVTLSLNDRVLVANQTTQTQNGVYTVTTVGDGSTAWVLTRSTDTDSSAPSDPNALGKGDAFFIKEGNTNAGHLDVLTTSGTITFGTTNIVFAEVAETTVYQAGDSLTLTGTTFDTVQDIRTTASPTFAGVTAPLTGNVTGNLTGNVTGNVTGNLTGDVTGNADTATALATARDIQLSGDVTGTVSFDGSGNVNMTTAVVDDSHHHVISNVDGLQTALDGKVATSFTVTSGNGLTGGGDLTANRTLAVGAGTGVTVNADDVAIGQDVATTASPTFAGATFNGNVGIGTDSADTLLELRGANPILTIRDTETSSASAQAILRLAETGVSDALGSYWDIMSFGGELKFVDNWNEGAGTGTRITINDAGRVGIGADPSSILHVEETNTGASTILKVINGDEGNTDTQTAKLELSPDSRATGVQISAEKETTNFGTVAGRDISMVFKSVSNNVPDESARLNSYGHFLFGTDTTVGVASAATPSGTWIGKNGGIFAGNDGTVGFFNRQSTDGDVIEVRKDGTTVGSIGVESSNPYIGSPTAARGIKIGGNLVPTNSTGTNLDNSMSLGASTVRWQNLYLSGGIYAGSGLGTNGQVLTSDGTNATWQDASGGSSVSMTEDAANYSLYIGSNTPTITGSNQFERNTAVGVNALNSLDVNVTNPSLNTAIGAQAGEQLTTADYCTFVGAEAGQNITTASYNTAVGARAGRGVAGTGNTYLGYFAGEYSNSSKDNQVMIGQSAGNDCWADSAVGIGVAAMSDGNHYRSVAVGYDALGRYSTSNAYYNVAIGYGALDGTYSGDGQTVVGYLADSNYGNGMAIGYGAICTGTSSTAIGYQVMATASNGSDYNTIVGYRAGYDMDGGDFNTFMGYQAGYAGGSGNTNTGIGSTALDALTSGSFNVGVGGGAGGGITTGSDNICIGTGAGTNGLTTGSNNIVIGRQIDPSSTSVSNEITLGNASITSFRCNVTTITSLSDERDKTAIEDLSYGLNFINDMRPVEFTWNRRDGTFGTKKDMGFIAQDLMDVEIEHSSATRTRLVNSENPDRLEADYMRTYPILVKAVQELSAKVDALEARIATLEGN